jgi:DNA-binding NtrC family response regulator
MSETRQPKILAIDDDQLWLEQVPLILSGVAAVETCDQIDSAFALLESKSFDVVLLDLNFVDDVRTGMDFFKSLVKMNSGIDVIVISGEANPQRLVDVFNIGITRFIPKPASIESIRSEVGRVLIEREHRSMIFSSLTGKKQSPLIGTSRAAQHLRNQIEELLRIGFKDLLIEGETGTGKEVLARYLAATVASSGRFLPVHCGAISDGLAESELFGHVKGAFTGADRDRIGVFESAAGGFVFLDEIGEMPLNQQAKLLRVVQERRLQRVGSFEERSVSFKTISATHVNLQRAVSEKRFREDLYFRIAKERIHLPTLRERKEDIPLYLHSFSLRNFRGEPVAFSPGAVELMCEYEWPGNVRQLQAIAEGLAARSDSAVIRERDVYSMLPEMETSGTSGLKVSPTISSYSGALIAAERRKFEKALVQAKGNRVDAAMNLGLSRATYFRRAKELGLIGMKMPQDFSASGRVKTRRNSKS